MELIIFFAQEGHDIPPGEDFQVKMAFVCVINTICRRDFHSGGVLRNRQHQSVVVYRCDKCSVRSDYDSTAVHLVNAQY